jgi:hypothetical protein
MAVLTTITRAFDVVGHFSRTLEDLRYIVANTLDLPSHSTKLPSKILYPLDFFPHSNPKHQAMVDEFVSLLESLLGTKRVEFSIAETWSHCPPAAAKGKPLIEYLAKVRPSRNDIGTRTLTPATECFLVTVS